MTRVPAHRPTRRGSAARGPARLALTGFTAVAAAALAAAQFGVAVAAPVSPQQGQAALSQRPLTAAQAAALSKNVSQPVIVFLRDEPPVVSAARSAMAQRSADIASSQKSLVSELAAVHATHLTAYRLVNAVAATVSPGEEARLEANPAVAKVIPDAIIKGPSPSGAATGAAATAGGSKLKPLSGACLAPGKVQLEPEALQVTGVQSQAKGAKTARSLGFTGAGVTVAYIADGIDIHNINFIKANGKSVFSDYKDFTGDGTKVSSGGGGEAFLDANSIAGQGRHVYNVQDFGAHPLTQACDIRIEGVAPGVSLVGLRVFGVNNATTTSAFLDAINYATVVHKVNVLNESFGSNYIPDTSVDAIKEFDDAAVRAGVTVVVASGDSSPGTDTIGSPATDPNVIAVGASTDFRAYAMSDGANADVFARGWLDDNISNITSSGFDESGAGIDLVAPGDSSFTSCTANLNLYPECTNFRAKASDIQFTGGTSQSSPLTAGVAALVIQAYRHTHGGRTPSPALIKQIIMSSATDLGSAGDEQGAGLLNAYKAVELAESYHARKAVGDTLLTSVTGVSGLDPSASRQGQIDIQDQPGVRETATFTVQNTGSTRQTVHLSGRRLSGAEHVQHGTVSISNGRSKHLVDFAGYLNNYDEFHFTVQRGQNRLNASMSFPAAGGTYPLSMDLIDPKGRLAAYSMPQGISDDANLDVINPAAGRWTAVIFGPVAGKPLFGTTGTVHYTISTQRFVSFGRLSRTSVTLARGRSATITLSVATPSAPGDQTGSVVLNGGHGASSIPVLLRSYVPVTQSSPGHFTGSLTGGNGRGAGQFGYYQFVVPSGAPGITAAVKLANDPSDLVDTYLVDPSGEIDGYGSNYYGSDSVAGYSTELTSAAFATNPIAGTWTLVVEFVDPTGGNETSDPYTGSISLTPGVTVGSLQATGVPDAYTTTITNNSGATEDFFLDPRLNGVQQQYPLIVVTAETPVTSLGVRVPIKPTGIPPEWLVPTESSSLTVSASATSSTAKSKKPFPFTFDASPTLGDPDVPSYSPGAVNGSTDPSVTITRGGTSGPLTSGVWVAVPAPTAKYGFSNPDSTSETASFSATVDTTEIDQNVVTATGDLWQVAVGQIAPASFTPVILGPGQSAQLQVDVTPTSTATVTGTLYVDDYVQVTYPAEQLTSSEVGEVGYTYN